MKRNTESEGFALKKLTVAEVRINGTRQTITWIRTEGLSVSLLISQDLCGGKPGNPRLIAGLRRDEGEDDVKAICRDYVRRQNDPSLALIPFRRLTLDLLRPDEEVEFEASNGRMPRRACR